jgi:uncharacterized protein (TIGR03437 family)
MIRIVLLCLLCPPLFAQKPVIGAVTNAATLAPPDTPGHALAAGSIATMFGQNLASGTALAENYPLPTVLSGASVTVNGIPAPLFYVSPTQINFQVPYATIPEVYQQQTYGHVTVVANNGGGASDPFTADTLNSSPGIFTIGATGCGQGAVLNVNSDGTTSLNSPSNSASPGSFISIYFTGLGFVYNPPPDGSPALADPLSRAVYGPDCASFEGESCAGESYGGRAPGLVGVDQENIVIPYDVRQGCSVPLQLGRGGPVLISIRSGGGACVDPPIGSEGEVDLTHSTVLNDNTIPESDTITAVFSASPSKKLSLPPVLNVGDYTIQTDARVPDRCQVPGYSTLDAGALTLIGPGDLTATVEPSTSGTTISYKGQLSAGAVQPGAFPLVFAGGPDIDAFQSVFNVGSPIQVTSQFPRGTGISPSLTVNWTGGQSGQTVTVKVRETEFSDTDLAYDYVVIGQAPATAGTLTIQGPRAPDGFHPDPFLASSDVEIDVEVGPDPAQPQIVPASGLTLGALLNWKYQYRFVGLMH